MKKLFLMCAILFTAILVFTGCKSDVDEFETDLSAPLFPESDTPISSGCMSLKDGNWRYTTITITEETTYRIDSYITAVNGVYTYKKTISKQSGTIPSYYSSSSEFKASMVSNGYTVTIKGNKYFATQISESEHEEFHTSLTGINWNLYTDISRQKTNQSGTKIFIPGIKMNGSVTNTYFMKL